MKKALLNEAESTNMNPDGELTPRTVIPTECCILNTVYNLYDNLERKMYTDQTGRFSVKLFRGIQYIMVLYELDSNVILVKSMQNRTSGKMVKAYQTLLKRLKVQGFEPNMDMLDNECSV